MRRLRLLALLGALAHLAYVAPRVVRRAQADAERARREIADLEALAEQKDADAQFRPWMAWRWMASGRFCPLSHGFFLGFAMF